MLGRSAPQWQHNPSFGGHPVYGSMPNLQPLQRAPAGMPHMRMGPSLRMPQAITSTVNTAATFASTSHPILAATVGGIVGGVIGWFAPFVGFKVGALVGAALGGGASLYMSGSLPFGATDVTFARGESPFNVARLTTQGNRVRAWSHDGVEITNPDVLAATLQQVNRYVQSGVASDTMQAPPQFAPDVALPATVDTDYSMIQKLGIAGLLALLLGALYKQFA
jgi:hypothetical protein